MHDDENDQKCDGRDDRPADDGTVGSGNADLLADLDANAVLCLFECEVGNARGNDPGHNREQFAHQAAIHREQCGDQPEGKQGCIKIAERSDHGSRIPFNRDEGPDAQLWFENVVTRTGLPPPQASSSAHIVQE